MATFLKTKGDSAKMMEALKDGKMRPMQTMSQEDEIAWLEMFHSRNEQTFSNISLLCRALANRMQGEVGFVGWPASDADRSSPARSLYLPG